MRDVEAFDHIRGTIQLKPLDKIGEIFPFALDRARIPPRETPGFGNRFGQRTGKVS